MKHFRNSTIYLFIFLLLFGLGSCTFSNKKQAQVELINSLKAKQELLPDSIRLRKELVAQQLTDSLDALRGYSLPESESSSAGIQIGYNTSVVLVVIFGLAFFGFVIFRLVKGVKHGIKNMSYAMGDMKEKAAEILNDPENVEKMSNEEREQIEKMLSAFGKTKNETKS